MNPLIEEETDSPRRLPIAREWIIFAICMGLGGHLVLGIVLHAPDAWPWEQAGRHALLVGFAVYVAVLLSRAAVRVVRTVWFRKPKASPHGYRS
jgi:hypothetical protein